MAKRNLLTCVYVSDEGKSMLRRIDARYQTQNTGGEAPALLLGAVVATAGDLGTFVNVPRDMRPRSVLLRTADGAYTARIPVFTVARYNALAIGDAINFYDGQGAEHAGVVYGKEGERSRHKTDVA